MNDMMRNLKPYVGKCQQCNAAMAQVYAMDPHPGGWGGYYCEPCVLRLKFMITDRLKDPNEGEEVSDEGIDVSDGEADSPDGDGGQP